MNGRPTWDARAALADLPPLSDEHNALAGDAALLAALAAIEDDEGADDGTD